MKKVYIEEKLGRKWVQKNGVYFTGCFFLENRLLTENEVYDYLLHILTVEDLTNCLTNLNGFFCFIIEKEDRIFAAVDRVRSIPLFYSTKNNVIISNDAEYVRKVVGDNELELIAVQEFTARMVCGSDTLFENVKQIQTGECIVLDTDMQDLQPMIYRYFSFVHSEKYSEKDRLNLKEQMLAIFSNCIDRLLQYAGARQLVLPLSAGYDSRFIALMLYKKRAKNVLCFSYGKKDNFEAKISKQVADVLGFEWKFIEYTKAMWYEWRHTDEYIRYLRMASGWSSLPCIQDFPAVWMLKKDGQISDDAIFIPGHVGDSLAGSDVPSCIGSRSKFDTEDFVRMLFINRYNNLQTLPKRILSKKIVNKWELIKKRTLTNMRIDCISSAEEYADASEKWNWLESNPKFIINSVRIYEFFGYDWYLPFVDKEFMEYWKDIPLCFRYGKNLYNSTVDEFFFELTNIKPPHFVPRMTAFEIIRQRIKNKILYTPFHSFYLTLFKIMKKIPINDKDTNYFSACFERNFIENHAGYIGGINFLLAVEFIYDIHQIMEIDL